MNGSHARSLNFLLQEEPPSFAVDFSALRCCLDCEWHCREGVKRLHVADLCMRLFALISPTACASVNVRWEANSSASMKSMK